MEKPAYIDFVCSNCGAKYWMENNYSKEEREKVIMNHCSKKCKECGLEHVIRWKLSKE